MGLFDSVTKGLGNAFGGIVGGAIGGAATDALGVGGVKKSDVRMGHEEDTRSYKERDKYDWQAAQDRGLTPQEFYGSSAAGGSAASGGAQILGNSKLQQTINAQKLAGDAINRELDRKTDIEKANIQADATRDAATTAAGASKYNADTQAAIAENRLALDRDTYKYVNLPTAAAKIGKTEKETEKIINEVATSEKDFVLYMKKLSMGVDNMLSEYYQNSNGFDVTKPETYLKFSPEKRKALLAGMLALQSQTMKEAGGAGAVVGNAISTGEGILELITGPGDGIELTPGAARALGNQGGRSRGHGARQ